MINIPFLMSLFIRRVPGELMTVGCTSGRKEPVTGCCFDARYIYSSTPEVIISLWWIMHLVTQSQTMYIGWIWALLTWLLNSFDFSLMECVENKSSPWRSHFAPLVLKGSARNITLPDTFWGLGAVQTSTGLLCFGNVRVVRAASPMSSNVTIDCWI